MITISKNNLDEIKQVCSIAKTKSPLEILQNVMIDAVANQLHLTASNLEIEITRSIEAQTDSEFKTTVNAQKFNQAIAACGEEIKIEQVDGALQIKSGRKRFKLPTIEADNFPALPEFKEMQTLDIDSLELAQLTKAVAFASAVNDVRFILNGVYVGQHIVGTDGHRMSWIDANLDCDLIIPRESVNAMPEIGGGKVYYNNNILALEFNDMQFKMKLIDGKFVTYQRLIPEYDKSIAVNKSELIDSIKSAMITANEKSRAVLFKFGASESTVKSKSGTGHDSEIGFEADCAEEIEMAINSDYLLAAVNNAESESLQIQYKDEKSPVFIAGEIVNSLVMPVRL